MQKDESLRGKPIAVAALLFFGIALGGGGLASAEAIVRIASILVMIWLVLTWQDVAPGHRIALLLVALIAATPIIQLVPLGASLWAGLPGHELPSQLASRAGVEFASRPLTLAPEGTRDAGLALIPGIAMFLATLQSSARERRVLAWTVVAVAVASALLALLQVASGGGFHLVQTAHARFPTGWFANRDHHVDLLLGAILLAAGLLARERRLEPRVLAIGLAVLLGVVTIATRSRTGIALLPFVLAFSATLLWGRSAKRLLIALAGIALLLCLLLLVAPRVPVLAEGLARFGRSSDARFETWPDILVAIGRFWPLGSGLGSFVPVYATVEALEDVSPAWLNHAHNDYLELLLETGIWGAALLVGGLGLIARQAWLASKEDPLARAGAACIAIILAHSLLDFPLRMESLLMLFGFAAGLLFPTPLRTRQRFTGRTPVVSRLNDGIQ